jgi:hypothetical protein
MKMVVGEALCHGGSLIIVDQILMMWSWISGKIFFYCCQNNFFGDLKFEINIKLLRGKLEDSLK